jgi:hypothetical protein
MTLFFASHEITIRRLRPYGAAKQNYSATFTAYYADIQPATDSRVQSVNGRPGATYEAWLDPNVPIKEGDQIDSQGKRYSVKAVSQFEGAGLLDHKHVILVSQNG